MLFVAHYELGCNHTSYFLNEATNPPWELWAIQMSFSVLTDIPFGGSNGLQSCEVLPNSSWYLGCNGTRVKSPLYQRKMKDLFALANQQFGRARFNRFSLEVRKRHHDSSGFWPCLFCMKIWYITAAGTQTL